MNSFAKIRIYYTLMLVVNILLQIHGINMKSRIEKCTDPMSLTSQITYF